MLHLNLNPGIIIDYLNLVFFIFLLFSNIKKLSTKHIYYVFLVFFFVFLEQKQYSKTLNKLALIKNSHWER